MYGHVRLRFALGWTSRAGSSDGLGDTLAGAPRPFGPNSYSREIMLTARRLDHTPHGGELFDLG